MVRTSQRLSHNWFMARDNRLSRAIGDVPMKMKKIDASEVARKLKKIDAGEVARKLDKVRRSP